MRTVEYVRGAVRLVDQTLLPAKLDYVECRTVEDVAHAIRSMQVRGAPAIGATAAFGLALAGDTSTSVHPRDWLADVEAAARSLRATRPTAVNLGWAIDRGLAVARESSERGITAARDALSTFAQTVADDDVAANQRIGAFGLELVPQDARILTHCNTGALATVGYGTALGMVRAASEAGKHVHVFVDETRPNLQGARLTAWELQRENIPYTLITDNMAGHFLSRGEIDLVVVGADRVAANGDVANKIGTYALAVLCKENGVPFYVAAPLSSIDLALLSGAEIPIEERAGDEVTRIGGIQIAPQGAHAAYPAFDITPARYIRAIVTERGVARPPFGESLRAQSDSVDRAASVV